MLRPTVATARRDYAPPVLRAAAPVDLQATSGSPRREARKDFTGNPGRELSVKQRRYLGYLIRQTGQEPDYSIISKLSQKEATLRIKDLEATVNGR